MSIADEIDYSGKSKSQLIERIRELEDGEAAKKSVLLQAILDASPAFISLRDIEGRFIFTNDLLNTEMKTPPEKSAGKTPTDIFGVVAGDTVETLVMEVIKSEQPVFQREIKSARREGRYFSYSVVPMFSDDGEISSVLAIGQDITNQKHIEGELAQKTALFQMILDATPALISLRDADGRFLFVNKQIATSIGVEPEDAIGKSRPDLHGDVSGDTIQKLAMDVLESKQPVLEQELQLARRPGHTFRYSIVPVFEDNEEVSGANRYFW
jgi:PAS domain S-box-containing protein